MFTDSTTKVDSEPPNGSNDDITNPYECNQTLYFSTVLHSSAGKSISLTEAKEEAVAREVHATHARIVSGPDPEPMQEDQTGSNSGKLHSTLPTKGIRSIISTVSISLKDFLPSILLLMVIIVASHTIPDPVYRQRLDHSADVLASIKSQVPTVVDEYLGTKLDDALLKILERHTADLIEKYSVLPGPEYEDAMDKDVTVSWIKPRVVKQKGEDKKKEQRFRCFGSAQPPTKDDEQSSKKPRSLMHLLQNHPALPSTDERSTDTRVADVDSSLLRSDPESEQNNWANNKPKRIKFQRRTSFNREDVMILGHLSYGSADKMERRSSAKADLEVQLSTYLVAIVASRAVDPVGSPSSTTIDQDEQSTSTSPSNQEIQSQVTHQVRTEETKEHVKEAMADSAWIEAMQDELH
ncbi:hypothetical protein Tco_0162948 [Tanacetum coccineum]